MTKGYTYGNANLLRIAEVVFTQRMASKPLRPSTNPDRDKLVETNAILAFEAAEAFSCVAEAWLTKPPERKR